MQSNDASAITSPNLMNMKRFRNLEIVNHENKAVGNIQDYILNVLDLSIDYVVVSLETSLGIKDKLYILPWQALKLDNNDLRFILPIDVTKLRNAPGYHSDWPETPEESLLAEVNNFYSEISKKSISDTRIQNIN